jgi:hypothetical protein
MLGKKNSLTQFSSFVMQNTKIKHKTTQKVTQGFQLTNTDLPHSLCAM